MQQGWVWQHRLGFYPRGSTWVKLTRRGLYMATSTTSTSVTTSRFDGKLDALLRRELSQSEYERLVATEVCISVPRGSGKRSHGHVIIGPSHLYFAPIPVKRIRLLLALSDVLSVTVVSFYNYDNLLQLHQQKLFTLFLHLAFYDKCNSKFISMFTYNYFWK